jgi:hypothetical protein
MSNFACEHCGANICDSLRGYVTGCEHYPMAEIIDSSPYAREDLHYNHIHAKPVFSVQVVYKPIGKLKPRQFPLDEVPLG